jgi:N-acyl-phosphatidylethanolamine-hydrolysing phospholipase D
MTTKQTNDPHVVDDVRADFKGDKILQNPPRAPGTDNVLSYYTQNCRGCYAADWEGAVMPGFTGAMKWMATGKRPKIPNPEEAAKLAPSVAVQAHQLTSPPGGASAVQATWMGHASYLVQVGGVNILTDPVWSDRCSPVQFAGPKRFVPPPTALKDLPRIDIVSISHNHYDHLDTATVKALWDLFQPIFVVPRGMKSWFDTLKWTTPQARHASDSHVFEFDWWEHRWLVPPFGSSRVLVTFVPVQHWSMRSGPWDRDKQLWGGWVYEVAVAAPSSQSSQVVRRIFHCGDTGYAPRPFKEIGAVFRRFDLAMIPIGAYHPRWFLHPQHVDPEQAVQIHKDLNRPTLSVGMHWGTFILTDEPIDEPPRLLRQHMEESSLPADEFLALKHGETVVVPGTA